MDTYRSLPNTKDWKFNREDAYEDYLEAHRKESDLVSEYNKLKGATIRHAFGIYKTANEKDIYDGCQEVTFDSLTRSLITIFSKPCGAKKSLLGYFGRV